MSKKKRPAIVVTDSSNPEKENYIPGMLRIGELLGKGGMANTIIEHDLWCPKLKGGICSCNPTFKVVKADSPEQMIKDYIEIERKIQKID